MFYDYEVFTATLEEIRNEIGEVEKVFVKGNSFYGDIQPIDESTKAKTWGDDTQATFTLYADKTLYNGDYVYYKEQLFEIEKKVDWMNYKIYALKWAKYEG